MTAGPLTAKVIQASFLGGQPKLASIQPKLAAPPIQAKQAARPPATAFTARPPAPPAPAFAPGPPAPAFGPRPEAVQRHGAGGAFAVEAGQLGLAAGRGKPLPETVRGKMEAALGADFSNVRVHVGPQAERIGAIAFTIGSDIYFAPGRYQPDTPHGQQLLGHELAHVVQQRAGRVRNPLGAGLAVVQDHALEAEADRLGRHAAAHPAAVQPKMPLRAAQPSPPVRISPPISAGPGSYRLTAGAGGRPVGSVVVHARNNGAVEVTDLHVLEAQRGNGIGQMLLASAAKTGLQFGKSKVTLAAQDNGSGHLTRWYKGMGFAQVSVDQRGYPQLEAPIGRILTRVAQPTSLQRGTNRVLQGCRPLPVSMRIIQRAHMDVDDDDEKNWDYPGTPPPTPAHQPAAFFMQGLDYHTQAGHMDASDLWEEKVNKHWGSVGQTVGTEESEDYDASYVEGTGIRPAATNVKALWNTVYAGLKTSGSKAGWLWVNCQELCGQPVWVDAKTKKEQGTGKRPPMCHITPFNHIKWAVEYLAQNPTAPSIKKLLHGKTRYIGGPATNLPLTHYQEVVWHASNLRAGHASCNSQTASQAKGNPKNTKEEGEALSYTIPRLNAINSGLYFV
jgi:ribosomal protein S18 acetylase RimI-like enzyme